MLIIRGIETKNEETAMKNFKWRPRGKMRAAQKKWRPLRKNGGSAE
jgi:hypothetical protein